MGPGRCFLDFSFGRSKKGGGGVFGGGLSSILIGMGRLWLRWKGLSEGIQDMYLVLGLNHGRRWCVGGKVMLLDWDRFSVGSERLLVGGVNGVRMVWELVVFEACGVSFK